MYDVVIIGGGPAGVTAGMVLQKEGFRTCIIDCKKFPREKLCAGVLSAKSIKLVNNIYNGIDLDSIGITYLNKIALFYKNEMIGKYIVKNKYGVVDRKLFDNELMKNYIKFGGELLDGQKNYKVLYDKNKIIMQNNKELKYRFLIGADGFNSKTRMYVDNMWKVSVLCFEKFVPNLSNEDTIKIYFGNVFGGYNWRIPGREKIGIGLGGVYLKGIKRSSNKYKKIFEEQGIETSEKIDGAFVSLGLFVKNPIKNNVLLIGDAAGLIDAISGEGIFFALESGRQAALALAQYFRDSRNQITYKKRLTYIHRKMREQRLFNKLLYAPLIQRMVISYMKKNPEFVQRVFDDVISSYKSGYIREIINNYYI